MQISSRCNGKPVSGEVKGGFLGTVATQLSLEDQEIYRVLNFHSTLAKCSSHLEFCNRDFFQKTSKF
jgi:hypothetical protein